MNISRFVAVGFVLLSVACDDKKGASSGAPSATASASAVAIASAPAPSAAPSAEPTTTASAAPSAAGGASGASMITGDAKDVVLTVKDPTKEPSVTLKAAAGGSVTVFLPDHPGTVWSVEANDKTLGKPKEEVIPGFAPGTNGHQFKWMTNGPSIKAGNKHKVQFGNKKIGDKTGKPGETFSLTIEIT